MNESLSRREILLATEAALSPPELADPETRPGLRGRRYEREVLNRLVADVRTGRGQVLVLRGEAGAGKTALLEYLLERADRCQTARAAGAESEMELGFAGLYQLCAPFLDRLERLPGPQRDALGVAFGLRDGDGPDRFLAGLAVLSLLSVAAEERPLICVVDNVQWLDEASARALAFVARHLAAGPVALLLAVRPCDLEHQLAGLAELMVGGLANGDARALLSSAVTGRLDEGVRDELVAEARGNPGVLLELAGAMSPEELAGGFGLPLAAVLAEPVEDSFRERLAPLPEATRRLLLVAAAEPTSDPVLVWQAAAVLGVRPGAVTPAEEAGLIESAGRVRFRDPLARFAVYRAASPQERRIVHHALAVAADPDADRDRRAWHHGRAAPDVDEEIAAELERAAPAVRGSGGLAADAAFRERAAELTPAPGERARRALAAAQVKHQAGSAEGARRLLALAQAGPLDEVGRAEAELLRAQLTADAPRPGRAAAAGHGGAAARAAAPRAGAASLPGRVLGGAGRRPAGGRPGAEGRQGGTGRPAAGGAAARRPAAGGAGGAGHRRIRRERAVAEAGSRPVLPRGSLLG